MDHRVHELLDAIGKAFGPKVDTAGRNYLEISIADQARRMGYADLAEKYRHAYAVIRLKEPQPGMKVRIDGRTFVNYAEYPPGIAVPAQLAREAAVDAKPFVAMDSMICNFT